MSHPPTLAGGVSLTLTTTLLMPLPSPALLSLDAALALTGLSKRTLWRRIAEGGLRKQEAEGSKQATALVLDDVLLLAGLMLDAENYALLQLADAGDATAQTEIGQSLLQRQRYAAAVYWLTRAAEQGAADAMQCLGHCHATGQGLPRDGHLALMWIAKAAAAGHPIARRQIAGLCPPSRHD
ncbi:hypothetical protein VX159_02335 [Dechloromonas sp. ZY10]|uniref:tetratricopeptide repeat protein n=1 Tax=Dechloromonas aquae TaxID=2664436 RepID=UPI00352807FD